jgi:uncharacterized protein (TIGR02117 family)
MLKKVFKKAGLTLLAIVSLLLIYVLAAWLLPYIPVNKDAQTDGPEEVSIYIKTNGVHTDIVAPMHSGLIDWNTIVPFENTDSKDTTFQYASFGWGDKGFYLETPNWSDLKFSVAFKAMFHLGSSAMHVTFYKEMQLSESCKEIKISKVEYEKLILYIKKSFQYDADGKTIQIITHNDGYGTDDAFYEAKDVYDLFHTCNTWANNALKAADQKACLWTALDKGIFYQYKD